MRTIIYALNVPGPTYSAPWMHWLSGFTGWLIATALFVLAIVLVYGIGAWVWGKVDGSQRAQTSGILSVGLGAVAAAIIAVAGSAIMWATDLGPDWMSF